jgi:hypothetical protein
MESIKYSMNINNQVLELGFDDWKRMYRTLKDIPDIEDSFYDSIVKNLKEEAKKINQKLITINKNNGDFNNYISLLKSLRETLDLINKYDWQLMYSEYDVINDNNSKQHQVSVWYQNHDNQIKDHKFWNVDGVGESIIDK